MYFPGLGTAISYELVERRHKSLTGVGLCDRRYSVKDVVIAVDFS
jgi:hypothetical protein